jgi:hypothetical protein
VQETLTRRSPWLTLVARCECLSGTVWVMVWVSVKVRSGGFWFSCVAKKWLPF